MTFSLPTSQYECEGYVTDKSFEKLKRLLRGTKLVLSRSPCL